MLFTYTEKYFGAQHTSQLFWLAKTMAAAATTTDKHLMEFLVLIYCQKAVAIML